MVPGNLRYMASHEWSKVDGDICTVGITSFAVHLVARLFSHSTSVPAAMSEPSDGMVKVPTASAPQCAESGGNGVGRRGFSLAGMSPY